ncbi:hypothetical protein C2Y63_22225 [Salmonella enterica subsp. enterica serovar Newport]|nr:hypothetical protein [Salmonella enterica subsp. enterica serovar Newport]EJI9698211.1 hypothetical protein [Salmonella enterica subsp. enterica serovar Infantis]EKE6622270.1 hypothetical protein [Salmonella enterica subsp. enterica serovar Braenderup]EKR7594764.1 hypothetical protein [Salmonella enterica]HED2944628.1 hypothetical protein [Enterobacter hormaechei subsp. xiangfangensis]
MKKIKYIEITDAAILKFISLNSLDASVKIENEIRKVADWMLNNEMFKKTGNKKIVEKIIDAASDYHKGCYLIYNFESHYNIEDFYTVDFNNYIHS